MPRRGPVATSPEQIIEKWEAAAHAGTNTNNLEVDVNISPLPAYKDAFEGYVRGGEAGLN